MNKQNDIINEITQPEIKELEDKIKDLKKELENYKNNPHHGEKKLLRNIIYSGTGLSVLKTTPEQMEEAKMDAILARDYHIDINKNAYNGRPNEFGNFMELVLKKATQNKLKGLGQSSGYPDLQNDISNYYLECKVSNTDKMDSTFRSFYLSTLNKITKSQAHVLVCFKHTDCKLSKDDNPIVIDLYDLELTLKCEWWANNKDMYSKDSKEPDYTIEELDEIMNGPFGIKDKNNKLSEICKRNKLKSGGKCEVRYERLVEYLQKYGED